MTGVWVTDNCVRISGESRDYRDCLRKGTGWRGMEESMPDKRGSSGLSVKRKGMKKK